MKNISLAEECEAREKVIVYLLGGSDRISRFKARCVSHMKFHTRFAESIPAWRRTGCRVTME